MRTQEIALSGLMICAVLSGVALTGTGCAGTATKRSTGAYLDDKGITARVKTALFRDPDVSGFDVHVNTYRGEVQLSGFVNNPEQRQRAADIARSVSGVRGVVDNLDVKPNASMGAPPPAVEGTSPTVTQPAYPPPGPGPNEPPPGAPPQNPPPGAFYNPGPAPGPTGNVLPPFRPNINISTSDGRAVIRGQVPTEHDKFEIEKKVREIPGIQSVDNELQVLGPH
jgi:osmotically-inducible protein OsmY